MAKHTADLRVENHGSIVLVRPLSERAQLWLDEHIGDESRWFAGALVVEPRYVAPLVEGMQEEGLEVEW
jgi:hypothetical protein